MKRGKWLVALLFAALTVAGLLTCADYGVPVDEWWEQNTLQENMHEYALHLGNTEAVRWYVSRGIQPVSQSTEIDHGQSAYYLFMPALAIFADAPRALTLVWHAYTWLWFMVGVWALYAFGREIGLGCFSASLGALLLYLCPRFFAEGHYNNKDMVLLSLVLLTFWLGVRFLKKPTFLRGALFSLAGAMAANTKIVGAMAWGVLGLCAILLVTADRRWSLRMLRTAVGTVALFAVFFTLLTPACWSDFGAYLGYLWQNATGFTRWTGVIIFQDRIFDQAKQPLPRYYLPYQMLTTLPLYVPVLAATGFFAALLRIGKQKAKALRDPVTLSLQAANLCWLVPVVAAMVLQPTLYNGWRHFYFVYAGIAALGAYGVETVLNANKQKRPRLCMMAVLFVCFGVSLANIAAGHPYQYTYYNALMGGKAGEVAELDYWELSTQNALQALLKAQRNTELPMCVGAREEMDWQGLWRTYPTLKAKEKKQLSLAEYDDPHPPYLLINSTYARIYGLRPLEGYHPLITLHAYGQTICIVYEKNP